MDLRKPGPPAFWPAGTWPFSRTIRPHSLLLRCRDPVLDSANLKNNRDRHLQGLRPEGFRDLFPKCLGDFSTMAKSTCPVTRKEFLDKAKPVSVTIGANTMLADVKEFSTGSLGWYLNGKATLEIDGKPVPVQIGLNLTLVGSKDLPRDGQAAA